MKSATVKSLIQNNTYVNPPVLPAHVEAVLHQTYRRSQAQSSLQRLSQGEIDVLEDARRQLGWPSIVSLAHKYYPLYAHRQCWRRALMISHRCRHCGEQVEMKDDVLQCSCCGQRRFHHNTLTIQYLLLAVITQVQYTLQAAFSGKAALIRLVHQYKYNRGVRTNRLVQPTTNICQTTEDVARIKAERKYRLAFSHDQL